MSRSSARSAPRDLGAGGADESTGTSLTSSWRSAGRQVERGEQSGTNVSSAAATPANTACAQSTRLLVIAPRVVLQLRLCRPAAATGRRPAPSASSRPSTPATPALHGGLKLGASSILGWPCTCGGVVHCQTSVTSSHVVFSFPLFTQAAGCLSPATRVASTSHSATPQP